MDVTTGAWTRRRIAGAAVGVLAVAGLVVAIGAGDEPEDIVELAEDAEDPTATTEADATTSTTTTTSTSSTSTTTTAPPPATSPVTSPATPVTTSPPATVPAAPPPPPPPPPPPTTPPAPSTTFGSIDIDAVRGFSDRNHVVAAVSPFVATGTRPCPAATPSGTDGGDDTVSNVTEWDLMRSCDGRLRLRMLIDDGLVDLFWMEIDSGPGGCGGVDFVALGYVVQGGVEAGLVATPACATTQWRWVDDVTWPMWNEYWLELHFRIPAAMGQSITWQAFARGRGEGAAGRDAVPNQPHTFSFA